MALDLSEGDLLVVNGAEYPVRSCAEYKWSYATSAMRRMLTESASTKRSPSMVAGKRGDPETNLTGLSCMPLDPIDAEVRQRLGLDTPHELLQTVLDSGDTFYSLVLEDLKR